MPRLLVLAFGAILLIHSSFAQAKPIGRVIVEHFAGAVTEEIAKEITKAVIEWLRGKGASPSQLKAAEDCAAFHFEVLLPVEGVEKSYVPAAIAACRKAVETFPDAPHLNAQLGRALFAYRRYAEAIEFARKAAVAGNTFGMAILGDAYRYGYGVAKDKNEGLKWYLKAAELGHQGAMISVGMHYHYNLKQLSEAIIWYRKSADLGQSKAMYMIGVAYDDSDNTTEAIQWYKRAAERGLPEAIKLLGTLYHYMYLETRSREFGYEAVKWHRKGAELGTADAMTSLGLAYEEGEGVDKNPSDAARWYKKAADLNDPAAMLRLGRAYLKGRGVGKSNAEAEKWICKAFNAGFYDAALECNALRGH